MLRKLFFVIIIIISIMLLFRAIQNYQFEYIPNVGSRYNTIGKTPQSSCLMSCIKKHKSTEERELCNKKCDQLNFETGKETCLFLKQKCIKQKKRSDNMCDKEYNDCMRGAKILPNYATIRQKKPFHFFRISD